MLHHQALTSTRGGTASVVIALNAIIAVIGLELCLCTRIEEVYVGWLQTSESAVVVHMAANAFTIFGPSLTYTPVGTPTKGNPLDILRTVPDELTDKLALRIRYFAP